MICRLLWFTSIVLAIFPFAPALACGDLDILCKQREGQLNLPIPTPRLPSIDPECRGDLCRLGQNAANTTAKAVQDVGNAINELQASVLSGPTLEQAIIASRNTAINGSLPIPPNIRQQLTGYASEASMNRVRYKIGDNGFLNLARLLEQGGFASAVTLNDVIVFHGPSEAADPSIWAHELTHVDQYADGTHSFAVQYARNYRSIEDPAYAKGNGFWNWQQQAQNALPNIPSPWPPQQQSGFPSGYGMKVCGCWGPNPPPFANEPLCASGSVRVNVCPGFCAPGHPLYAYVCS